jgi:AcrR family transcriptional regulator
MPTTEDKGKATGVQERILEAAVAVLRESGIQKLSQVEVARRAEVRQSHLTYYFPRRHDLLEAIAVQFVDGVVNALRQALDASPGDGEKAVLETLSRAIRETEHMRMFIGVIAEADGDAEVREVLVRGARRLESALAEGLGAGNAGGRAQTILAALWGIGLYEFVVREPEKPNAWDPLMECLRKPAR